MVDLSKKRNGRLISCYYPSGGNRNNLRKVQGKKLCSGTGPSGKFITVQEDNGQIRSLTLSKVVQRLS
jgi:hypothetical protein